MNAPVQRLRKIRLERTTDTIEIVGGLIRHLTTVHGDMIHRHPGYERTPLPEPTIDEKETNALPTVTSEEWFSSKNEVGNKNWMV